MVRIFNRILILNFIYSLKLILVNKILLIKFYFRLFKFLIIKPYLVGLIYVILR